MKHLVRFRNGKGDSIITFINKKVSFAQRGIQPEHNDVWFVEIVGQNKKGNVNFLKLVEKATEIDVNPERYSGIDKSEYGTINQYIPNDVIINYYISQKGLLQLETILDEREKEFAQRKEEEEKINKIYQEKMALYDKAADELIHKVMEETGKSYNWISRKLEVDGELNGITQKDLGAPWIK